MASLFDYFDLNIPLPSMLKSKPEVELDNLEFTPEEKIAEKEEGAAAAAEPSKPPAIPPPVYTIKMKWWEQLIIYLGLALGVLLSTAIEQYKAGTLDKLNISLSTVIVSLAISLIILPYVYGKLNIDPQSPVIMRLSVAVQQGVFWQVLFGAIAS